LKAAHVLDELAVFFLMSGQAGIGAFAHQNQFAHEMNVGELDEAVQQEGEPGRVRGAAEFFFNLKKKIDLALVLSVKHFVAEIGLASGIHGLFLLWKASGFAKNAAAFGAPPLS
jgi:hypothetical protein